MMDRWLRPERGRTAYLRAPSKGDLMILFGLAARELERVSEEMVAYGFEVPVRTADLLATYEAMVADHLLPGSDVELSVPSYVGAAVEALALRADLEVDGLEKACAEFREEVGRWGQDDGE